MQRTLSIFMLVLLLAAAGCTPAPNTKPLGRAFQLVTMAADEAHEAFAAGDPERAHDTLHDVGEVIKSLPLVASQAKLSADAQKQIVTIQDELYDAFGEYDGVLHAGTEEAAAELDHEAVDAKIRASLEKLKEMLPAEALAVAAPAENASGAHQHEEEAAHDHAEEADHDEAAHDHAEEADHDEAAHDHAEEADHDEAAHDHADEPEHDEEHKDEHAAE
ncbi:hypothetical protein Mal64_33960 [Pseudobythopirellula maris]|uniref:Uncharacterized protein n=1 Tax=Pseudobythopirellula maris TaxID=2527991 RepID=A0A5C5ZHH8_9BACT|nr:hypothetical protein [Pseudobythopirellula maris]TWT86570.1 hypothetical protein Mal64_33960 [Pseudobythopirellula maris]